MVVVWVWVGVSAIEGGFSFNFGFPLVRLSVVLVGRPRRSVVSVGHVGRSCRVGRLVVSRRAVDSVP